MNILKYIIDKKAYIISCLITVCITEYLLYLFDVNIFIKIYNKILIILAYILPLTLEYIKKRAFYVSLNETIGDLDKKYLFTEIVKRPNFLEGQLIVDNALKINYNIAESINAYKSDKEEYKEYIELWVHEIKTPIASTKLIIENNKNSITKSIEEELEKIETYIEQTLFYARSSDVEKDYIITDTNLKELINSCIKKNKKDLIRNKFQIDIKDIDVSVKTDAKWMQYIISQIINNSIKYHSSKTNQIEIWSSKSKNSIDLYIKDGGVGIAPSDLPKVMQKGFTGMRGRIHEKSTGIGLYLCKRLIDKLNHDMQISSIEGESTTVKITFPNSAALDEII
ncbi:MAG: sensor histidine kinase [Clostridia bacterium]